MSTAITWQKDIPDWPHKVAELVIDPLRTALLVIDISNHSSEPVSKIFPNIIRLRNFFRENNLKVFYCLVGAFLPDGRDQYLRRRFTWHRSSESEPSKFYPKGTWEHEIREGLNPLNTELVIDKNSGSAFNSSAADYYLKAMRINNLVACGMVTSRCVENTVRDAADKGYNVILAEDACGDSILENSQTTIHTFSRVLGSVKSTEEVIRDLSRLVVKRSLILQEATR